ncbi:Splicing factor 3B subunit 1, partial [Blattella germanica]
DEDDVVTLNQNKRPGYTAPAALLNDVAQSEKDYDPFAERRPPKAEDNYRNPRRRMIISPERVDPFAEGLSFHSSYKFSLDLFLCISSQVHKQLVEKSKDGTLKVVSNGEAVKSAPKKRGRWDQTGGEDATPVKKKATSNNVSVGSSWDKEDSTPASTRWDETPGHGKGGETPGATPGQSTRMWDATPGHATPGHATPGRETPSHDKGASKTPGHNSGWAETPRTDRTGAGDLIQETPTPSASKRRSRWDETPSSQMTPGAMTPQTPGTPHTPHGTPHGTPHATPSMMTPSGVTPTGTKAMAMATPTPEPLLIDEDYYARVEGREIISNLAKAAGLATMISTMRPDIDNIDEYVRNTTARAFAVVASALGIPSLLPFLKAVCRSKKSWQARHTGIKIVQQIAILMGCAILPHLKSLVEIIEHGLIDEQQKVRTITALAIAALAEAATPYGIESFDSVLKPLWKGIRTHRGKGLAAFLKAIGYLIPLMDAEYANYYTREVMLILIREFQSPDEEMKKIVLKVVKQCCGTDGVESQYIKDEILPHFFKHFWNHRMALDRRNYRQVCTLWIDHSIIDVVMLNGFGTIVNQLGKRVKAYLPQICGTILWRLNNKSAKVRQQAADLISRIAVVMKTCQEEKLMGHLGVVLYEYLGEEYPEVLGSILGALKAIVNVIGMTKMTPPIKDLLPRLTPILKNRHEKVQENCIDLVGRIADRGPEYVSAREWMRICFELLELLKAHKKAIRRATVNTFGYIAKAIGPHDVLATLLNNLKVQERQNRVCTTVAIAIVAETCSPFTVLPALMNEYRVPELNVQNGVLKSLSDLVHRQTACAAIKHMALGVYGFGCEDALIHLLNHVWPNIFETSPHLVQAFMDSIEGLRVALGPNKILQYVLQGLFHPARKVRDVYWKIYNSLYIGGQDALVAGYPRIANDPKNQYIRYELDYIL